MQPLACLRLGRLEHRAFRPSVPAIPVLPKALDKAKEAVALSPVDPLNWETLLDSFVEPKPATETLKQLVAVVAKLAIAALFNLILASIPFRPRLGNAYAAHLESRASPFTSKTQSFFAAALRKREWSRLTEWKVGNFFVNAKRPDEIKRCLGFQHVDGPQKH